MSACQIDFMANDKGSLTAERSGAWMVLLAAVCWGTTGTAQAFAPEGATPLSVGAIRLAVGGAALLLWALWRRAFRNRGVWPIGATLLAAACMAAYQLFFFAAVERTGVAVGTVVAIGSGPVFAGLFGWLARREIPEKQWFVATLLATAGCVLLGISGGALTFDPTGILLALGAGASYALYVLAGKSLVAVQQPEAVMAVVFTIGAIMLSPFYFTENFAWLAEPRGLWVALHLGIVTTALAYALFAEALTTTPVATAVTLTLGEPLTATLLSVVVLHESLNRVAIAGLALIFLGLVILALAARRINQASPMAEPSVTL